MTDTPIEHIARALAADELPAAIDNYARAVETNRDAYIALMEARKVLVDVLHRAGVKGFTL